MEEETIFDIEVKHINKNEIHFFVKGQYAGDEYTVATLVYKYIDPMEAVVSFKESEIPVKVLQKLIDKLIEIEDIPNPPIQRAYSRWENLFSKPLDAFHRETIQNKINKIGLEEVFDAIEIAYKKSDFENDSTENRFKYFCGVCKEKYKRKKS